MPMGKRMERVRTGTFIFLSLRLLFPVYLPMKRHKCLRWLTLNKYNYQDTLITI